MPDERPVLDQINLVVGDMDSAMDFYRRLGVEIAPAAPPWDGHHREVAVPGDLHLDLDSQGFAATWNEGWPDGAQGVVIGFRLATRDDVDATYDDLTSAGYEGQQAPYDAFWGARYAVVQDPAGNSVGLMSPADHSRRTAPPAPPS